MALLLKNAHVVDPSVELDGVVDVLIDGDKIAEVGEEAALRAKYPDAEIVDAFLEIQDQFIAISNRYADGVCEIAAKQRQIAPFAENIS